jgi:hypothetical protein
MQLTPHFTLEELIASENAARLGIDNTPSPLVLANLKVLALGLESVRECLGGLPIHVNSGFRCPELNKAIGGAPDSRHMVGLAADIVCPAFGKPLQVCQALVAKKIPVDQIIHEFGQWCHVSFAATGGAPRFQLLTIASAKTGYQNGILAV